MASGWSERESRSVVSTPVARGDSDNSIPALVDAEAAPDEVILLVRKMLSAIAVSPDVLLEILRLN